jgi:hypothetical protein
LRPARWQVAAAFDRGALKSGHSNTKANSVKSADCQILLLDDGIGRELKDAVEAGQRSPDHERVMKNTAKQAVNKQFECGNSGAGAVSRRDRDYA